MALIQGNGNNNTLSGGSGNDTIYGYGGNDTIYSNNDFLTDIVYGGDGDDSIFGGKSDFLRGEAGNDYIKLTHPAQAYAYGGTGHDLLDGSDSNSLTGAVQLSGDEGYDTLVAGKGKTNMYGGEGDDIFVYTVAQTAGGFDNIAGGDGFDQVLINLSNTAIEVQTISEVESIYTEETGVTIVGTAYDQVLDFSGTELTGVESINMAGGNDAVTGSIGADVIYGGDGSDTITGEAGADILYGDDPASSQSADTFAYSHVNHSAAGSADTIADFSSADGDKIDLSAIDADSNTVGDDAFSFVGTAAFSGAAGELRYDVSGGTTSVYADVDGDGSADFQIDLTGSHSLSSADFLA